MWKPLDIDEIYRNRPDLVADKSKSNCSFDKKRMDKALKLGKHKMPSGLSFDEMRGCFKVRSK